MKRFKYIATNVLFWEFNIIFMITCVLAVCALVIVLFFPSHVENHPLLIRFTWALWVSVLGEIAVVMVFLFRNLMLGERPQQTIGEKAKCAHRAKNVILKTKTP